MDKLIEKVGILGDELQRFALDWEIYNTKPTTENRAAMMRDFYGIIKACKECQQELDAKL